MSSIDFSRFSECDADQVDIRSTGIERYLIDMTKDYPPVDFLLKYNGVGCVPKGDLQAMTGKMKTGKSFACSCLETAMLTGHFMGFEATKNDIRILHVDTEQSPATIAKRAKTVHMMCDWPVNANNEQYRTICLREVHDERLEKIIEAIEQFKPDFVFIDGIRDLLDDFNDTTESSVLIKKLLMLCSKYGVGIMCILHENKADENMRGHLGTELGNKCSEIYKVKRNKTTGVISVEQTVCRNEPIEEWAFSIGESGIPQSENVFYVNPTIAKRNETFDAVFKLKEQYTHTELRDTFMEIYGCEKRCAIGHIKDAVNAGLLHQSGKLYYYGQFKDVETEIIIS